MSYFDDAFRKAFPPPIPWRPYVWPKLVRDVVLTKLERSAGQGGGGKRIPIPVRRVSLTELVRTYHFTPAPWTRIKPTRDVPHCTLLPSANTDNPGVMPAEASSGRRSFDPYGDFAFHIEIEGVGAGAFTKLDGLDVEIDQIEYMDSLDPHPHKRPGIHRYGNLKLTKGVIANDALWQWCLRTANGDVQRRNGSVHVLADPHDTSAPEMTFHFYQAWPCKWSGLKLDGKGSATLIEELELVVDWVARA